jgi:hypothetical protein
MEIYLFHDDVLFSFSCSSYSNIEFYVAQISEHSVANVAISFTISLDNIFAFWITLNNDTMSSYNFIFLVFLIISTV